MQQVKTILLDIEGTTSSIRFVHEVLFPYAQTKLREFISNNYAQAEVKKIIDEALRMGDSLKLETLSPQERIDHAVKIFEAWINEDKKIKTLKDLQGLIWEHGYQEKAFYGHLYNDAFNMLKEWHDKKLQLCIYSSGSVHAQKLLFGHTEYGDLNYLFDANFDTSIGAKKERDSYLNIVKKLKREPAEILFLSDNSDELKAAKEAGLLAIKVARAEDSVEPDIDYISVTSFKEIEI